MTITRNSEHIKIEGYRGKWYVIDDTIYNAQQWFLLEHETYGDETASLIVDCFGNVAGETWDDIRTGLEDCFEYCY